MGKEHWLSHNQKPTPIIERDLDQETRLVIRHRVGASQARKRYVATVRYIHPPVPGQYVVLHRYGSTPEEAERRVLSDL